MVEPSRVFKQLVLVFLCILSFVVVSPAEVTAQSRPDVINANNASRLEAVAVLGTGTTGHNVGWSPDSRTLAIPDSRAIYLYNSGNFEASPQTLRDEDSDAFVFSDNLLEFNAAGDLFVVGDYLAGNSSAYTNSDAMRIYAYPSGRVLNTIMLTGPTSAGGSDSFSMTGGGVNDIAVSPDGRTFAVATNGSVANLRVFDSSSGSSLGELSHGQDRVTDGEARVYDVDFSRDGRILVSAASNGIAAVWNTRTGQMQGTLQHNSLVDAVAISPDSALIVTGVNNLTTTTDSSIVFWDASTYELLGSVMTGLVRLEDLEFHPTEPLLAMGGCLVGGHYDCREGGIVLVDLEAGEFVKVLNGHPDSVIDISFSPDGRMLTSRDELRNDQDALVVVWAVS